MTTSPGTRFDLQGSKASHFLSEPKRAQDGGDHAATIPQGFKERWAALLVRMQAIARSHPDAVLASSMSAEDMVLTHVLFSTGSGIEVMTLNTGRLHRETLNLIDVVGSRYQRTIQIVLPDQAAVDEHVLQHGEHAFYDSIELRKSCCAIRKVSPLAGALKGRSAWITGQRRTQSQTRTQLPEQHFDDAFGLEKFNPLADWSHDDVWHAIRQFDIPYNPLHDVGYPSIGCEPCTRAIRPGEDERAGRWWWENAQTKECGLHPAGAPS